MFGMPVTTKWFVTFEIHGIVYYLAESDDAVRHLTWSQQIAKALKFNSSADAEKIAVEIKNAHKNKKLVFKVK